jgi:precorrin-3B synthase
MPTGDGLLVRLHPALGRLTAGQLRAIATAARSCGNGLLDVTRRGNLQIRGLSKRSHRALVEQLAAAQVDLAGQDAPRRTVVSPLAGRDRADHVDAAALAERVEAAVRAVPGLPGKLAVAVDGGGLFPLVELDADIYAVAIDGAAIAVGLAAADGPRWCGTSSPAALPSAIAALLTLFAAAVASGFAPPAMRDAPADLRTALAAAARFAPPTVPSRRPPALRAGILHAPGGGAGVVLALPFGRCDADQLTRIAGWAEQFADGEVRLSPWRGIVFPEVPQQYLTALIALASDAGLITEPGDPRLDVFACPGRPDCASASVMTRRDASRLAAAARPLLRTGASIHVSGCAKGCAYSGSAALTLVGDDGAYRVVVDGRPRDSAAVRLTIEDIERRLASVESRADLASRFSAIKA